MRPAQAKRRVDLKTVSSFSMGNLDGDQLQNEKAGDLLKGLPG